MVGGEVALTPNAVRLSPSFYLGENGEAPVCSACGAFMAYSHTEVLKPRRRCMVSDPDENRRVPY